MAETKLSDVIVPTVFDPYVSERSIHLNKFFQAGVLVQSPVLFDKLAGGSNTFNFPFWKDLSGDSEILDETNPMTVNEITADKMIARRQLRGKAWGATDLAAQLSGDNPIQAIGDRVAQYWATQYEKLLTLTVRGIIADNVANDSSDLVVDISIDNATSATAANKISAEKTIDAVLKQGDHFSEVYAIAVHSTVYSTLLKNDLIDYVQDSRSNLLIPKYMGLNIVVDDDLPVIAVTGGYKYHSYLFKQGAIAFAENPGKYVANEAYRDPKGIGVDSLYTRRQFCIHLLGFSWVLSPDTATSPSDAQLYTLGSWDRVYSAKNAGVIALISNG